MVNETNNQTRIWTMLCHLTALSALLGVPLGNILGPLVVWLIKRNEMPAVDAQGKESLNFQISMTIYFLVIGFAALVLSFIFIGFLLIPVLALMAIADIVLVILASIKANEGGSYEYPFTIRFIT